MFTNIIPYAMEISSYKIPSPQKKPKQNKKTKIKNQNEFSLTSFIKTKQHGQAQQYKQHYRQANLHKV